MLLSFFNSDSPLPSNWEGLTPTIVLFNIRKRCFPLIHWPLRCSLLPVNVIQLMEMKYILVKLILSSSMTNVSIPHPTKAELCTYLDEKAMQ